MVKATGITRAIDNLGRIVIPMELRRTLGIAAGDPVDVRIEGDRIVLRRDERACTFCGDEEVVHEHMGKNICGTCLAALAVHLAAQEAAATAV